MAEAKFVMTIANQPCEFHISVPEGKTGPESALPFARELTNKIVEFAIKAVEEKGEKISCTKGCGACCDQLVPVSETEAREISKMIQAMPKVRKQQIMERFRLAREKLESAGIWEQLIQPQSMTKEETFEFGINYFRLGIPCPFLEEGACSIHPSRPLTCREFLVTSDAKYCSSPDKTNIRTVEIPKRMSNAYARLYEDDPNYVSHWVALITVPFWPSRFPSKPASRQGPQWIEALIQKMNE